MKTILILAIAGTTALGAGAVGGVPSAAAGTRRVDSGKVRVVAAEDVWGSIVRQIGGSRVSVTSIVKNPDTDPHDYEPTPSNGRAVASADYVVVNGIGYDPWARKLVDANPDGHRKVLDVGNLVGVKDGGNPHQWYAPTSVLRVAHQVAADLATLDPMHAPEYARRETTFVDTTLGEYQRLIAEIRQKYRGTPVGASESIVAPLAAALGLDLVTPQRLLEAVSEGSDPTAQDRATVERQVKRKQIAIFVFNSQNATPDVKVIVKEAKASRIPVVTVTETLVPAGATFQTWQVRQLRAIEAALAAATGR